MKVGNNEVTDILLGDTQVLKVYRGEDVIWERGGLPSEYTRLQYLESTGTQYIDTGIYGSNNVEVRFGFNMKSNETQYIFGACLTYNYRTFTFSRNTISNKNYKVFVGSVVNGNGNVPTGISQLNGADDCLINASQTRLDNEIYNYTPTSAFTTPFPITLFARNNNGTIDVFAKVEISYFKIYDNNTLVRDFVPCLDNNNRPCMYDLVTRQPFYNQGTGEFLYA